LTAEGLTPIGEFDYSLPEAAIAQVPAEPREAARLLVALEPGRPPLHRGIAELPGLLGPGDVLVVNDSRVIPARLHLQKQTGGQVEVLLLAPARSTVEGEWEALVRPGRRVPPGTVLQLATGGESGSPGPGVLLVGERLDGLAQPRGKGGAAEVGAEEGIRLVRLLEPDLVERHGELPLPPYIHEKPADPERYQTVYARRPVSVAAPTAGLHFSEDLLERCQEAGAQIATVELAVGLGTFRPIAAAHVEEHRIHAERYRVPAETLAACRSASRVIAVGTTALRALETVAAGGPLEGETDLYVHGDYRWRVVDALLTNYHLPRSSLLVLLASFAGPSWRELYEIALENGYRFLSFGDAMLVTRHDGGRLASAAAAGGLPG
jgi:S-adenosylmethionine:tRNA ribosyltransferase-isomerase